jgi:hypothetical protein
MATGICRGINTGVTAWTNRRAAGASAPGSAPGAIFARVVEMTLIAVALAACGHPNPIPDSNPSGTPGSEPPPVKDTAFGDMVGTMDKARGVETTTLQHKQDMDRTLEQQEGNRRQD